MSKRKLKHIEVIYEDNHLLVVNKPAGLLVQGDATGDKPLVEYGKDYIKEKYDKPGKVFLGVVHRIDRPVSGLVVFARTSKALERMNKLFHDKKVQKTYWAITKQKTRPEKGKLVNWLIKDSSKNITKAFDEEVEGAKRAELNYRYLGTLNRHHLIEVKPKTGRPHQIRVQLAHAGCPIRGDIKYGFNQPNADASIHLHARKLYFIHPIKKEPIELLADVPEAEFWEQFLTLDSSTIKKGSKQFD
ncbi:MAG: RluA family pseudouridine synthase [Thiotrichaceae bacterium]|nr:RluA family pseudouridine synthase [Thiotrichaceae bacterium]